MKLSGKMSETFKTEDRYALAAEASQVLNDDAANLFLTNSLSEYGFGSKSKECQAASGRLLLHHKNITVRIT